MLERDECFKVVGGEFPDICGPMCDPDCCAGEMKTPTTLPSKPPTKTHVRTPTIQPTPSPPSPCDCQDCTDDILNTMAGNYSCGARINWLQTSYGGSMLERDECFKVAGESPQIYVA